MNCRGCIHHKIERDTGFDYCDIDKLDDLDEEEECQSLRTEEDAKEQHDLDRFDELHDEGKLDYQQERE